MKREESRRIYQNALNRGELIRPENCSICNGKSPSRALDGHHPDYSKPLNVVWVCNSCHGALPPGAGSDDDTNREFKELRVWDFPSELHHILGVLCKLDEVSVRERVIFLVEEHIATHKHAKSIKALK